MNYFINEYRDRFYPTLSISTVMRYIKGGNIPSNHKATKGKQWVIEVKDMTAKEFSERVEITCTAVWTHFRKVNKGSDKPPIELISTMCMKYGAPIEHIKIVLGLK